MIAQSQRARPDPTDWLPYFFILVSLLMGGLFAFVNPPFQAPDEFGHFFRAYGISEGYLVAAKTTRLPESVVALTRRFPLHLETVRKIESSELVAAISNRLSPENATGVSNEGTNLNTWFPYIPAAAAILIGRLLGASPLVLLYLGRLANLAAYSSLVFLALRLLPACRPLLFVVALSPMVLYQAASLSWDSIAFALAFLFCALLIRLAMSVDNLTHGELIALLAGVAAITLCKVDVALMPLLLLIPVSKFGTRRNYLVFLSVCIALSVALTVYWQAENRENVALFQLASAQRGVQFPSNIWFLYFNTGYVLNAIVRTAIANWYVYLTNFAGTFGWLAVNLPSWAVLSYTVLFITTGLVGAPGIRWTWMQRAVLVSVVILGAASVLLAMWLAETPLSYIQDVILQDAGALPGIQGRHFVPFAIPVLLLLGIPAARVSQRWLLVSASVVMIGLDFVGLQAIRARYYGHTAATSILPGVVSYEGRLVRRSGPTPCDQ